MEAARKTDLDSFYHFGRFTTIKERNTGEAYEILKKVEPLVLDESIVSFLKAIENFETDLRFTIPRWDKETSKEPDSFYTFRMAYRPSRHTKIDELFLHPYNPMIVEYAKGDRKNGKIIGVIFDVVFFGRDPQHTAFIEKELKYITDDVENYFATVGRKYGRCMICNAELTSEKSLAASIGPVCGGYVGKFQKAALNPAPIKNEEGLVKGIGVGYFAKSIQDRTSNRWSTYVGEQIRYPYLVNDVEYTLVAPNPEYKDFEYIDVYNPTERPAFEKKIAALESLYKSGILFDFNGTPFGAFQTKVYSLQKKSKTGALMGLQYNDRLTQELKNLHQGYLRPPKEKFIVTSVKDKEIQSLEKDWEAVGVTKKEPVAPKTIAKAPRREEVRSRSPVRGRSPTRAVDGPKTIAKSTSPSKKTHLVVEGDILKVFGGFTIKEQLKALGGRWKAKDKYWELPKNRLEEVQALMDSSE